MKVVIITGTPGTGKSTMARRIARIAGFHNLSVNSIIRKNKLSEGLDTKRKSKIIDIQKLSGAIVSEIKKLKQESNGKLKLKKGIVIESHLSHYIPKRYVDLCIVTTCDVKKLEERLKKRRYSKTKIRENLDAEIFDICHVEATQLKHNVVTLDTSKRLLNKDLEKLIRK